jgi:cysteine desulfurase/selenocysteine lyase
VDTALIERLANELFAGASGALSGATPSLGSAMPPRNADLAIPLTGGDPLDLHLDTPRTHTPQLPVSHDWAPGADFAVAPNLDTSYPGEDVLRDLLKDNAKEHPKMTGASFYFLDEAARFKQSDASVGAASNKVGQSTTRQVGGGIDTAASSNRQQAGSYNGDPAASQIITSGHPAFDVLAVRRDFPILKELVNGRPLAWLDNAATTQKPQSVIDRLSYFYEHENSNIHRAAHELAARATDAYEGARDKIANFLNASSSSEIVFVRGTTEAINLVAKSWGKKHIGEGDEILISHLEHHANIVPWQMLCAETGAVLRVAPVDDDGQVLLNEYERLLNSRTKLVSFTQVSNALGTVTPAKQMIEMAHRYGAKVLLDGAQSVSHLRADVQYLDCDFFVFSGHKVFGPTGIGALYGKPEVLENMPPWQGGGNMIEDVTIEKTRYHPAPGKFEAGTGNIADAVGLGAAIDYVQKLGIDNICRYEHELLVYAMKELRSVPGLRLIGTAPDKTSVLSFVLEGYQTTEVGEALNKEGIAVRTGHHCAQPILRRFGLEATVRPSLAFYNTHEEIDRLVNVVRNLSRK